MKGDGAGLERTLFRGALIVLALLAVFALGLHAGATRNGLYRLVTGIGSDIEEAVNEAPNFVRPVHFLQPARYPGQGVIVNEAPDQDALVLLAGFFEDSNELRLVRRDGTPLARWPVRFSDIFPDTSHLKTPPVSDWNIDLHGALALPDGSVVFNFEYGGLVKLDRCGKIVWTVRIPSHHSVEHAGDGGFWVPGRRYHAAGEPSPFPPFHPPYAEDTLVHVSADGQVLEEISVPGLFYANELVSLLTATGETIHPRDKWDQELVHLNKIAELNERLAPQFDEFDAGDLLLSMREFNLLMVVDPVTRKIKWWRIGPWVRQHDPEFAAGGKILLFNNNIYRAAFGSGSWGVSGLNVPRVSNITLFDPATEDSQILYGSNPAEELLSIERGKVDRTPSGGLLVTEFEGGRVFETAADGRVIWEYLNRYDNNLVAEVSEARIYPGDYFDVDAWSCPTD